VDGSEHGPIKLSTYFAPYKVGDIVDIKANAAQQKGMPHKYYHGYVSSIISPHVLWLLLCDQSRIFWVSHASVMNPYLYMEADLKLSHFRRRTGIITNVTPSAVAVLVHKVVGNRYIAKRVNLRVEHVSCEDSPLCYSVFCSLARLHLDMHDYYRFVSSVAPTIIHGITDSNPFRFATRNVVESSSTASLRTHASTVKRRRWAVSLVPPSTTSYHVALFVSQCASLSSASPSFRASLMSCRPKTMRR